MSRRSRRRRGQDRSGWFGKAVVVSIFLGLAAAAATYAVVLGYLHSDSFRLFLSQKVSTALGVVGQFGAFRWDGLAVETTDFQAEGEGVVKRLRLDGLHSEVGLGGVRRGVWEVRGSRVRRVEVWMDASGSSIPSSVERSVIEPATARTWLPKRVELQGLQLDEVVLHAMLDRGPASMAGMSVRMEPAGGDAYRAELAGARVRLPIQWLPELRIDQARVRYQADQVFLNSASVEAWEDSLLEAAGEWNVKSGRFAFQGDVAGVRCGDVFRDDWARRITGVMHSDFTVDNRSGAVEATGNLVLRDGTLTALPVLDALAAYADTRRFRVLQLSESKTRWRWSPGELDLSELVLFSEGLARLEGSILIRGEQIDGTFRLGLAPGTLSRIPGAETEVFVPGERGLIWTPLRITGTLDDPKEDLTERLIAAAGARMFDVIPETGERVIRFSRSLLDTPAKDAAREGVRVIEKGVDVVDDVGGLIDGFFGRDKQVSPESGENPDDR